MPDDIYTPPTARLDQPPSVPDDILKKIRSGWVVSSVSVAITVYFYALLLFGDELRSVATMMDIFGSAAEIVVAALLTYGFYRKSRVCASLVLLLFVANKVLLWTSGATGGLALAAVMIWYLAKGVIGTFQYHAFLESPVAAPPTE